MFTTRLILIASTLFVSTNMFGQISVSTGLANTFQTDNNYEGPEPFFGSGLQTKIREQYWVDSYFIGIDYQRDNFNLMTDVYLSTNKLKVHTSNNTASGNGYGYNSTTNTYGYSINYGSLGFRISPQRVFKIHDNFSLLLGPFVQLQFRLYEREYDHLRTETYYHSYNYTGTQNIYESTTTDTEEFNGMDIDRRSGRIGMYLYPKITFTHYFFAPYFSGGLGFTARRNLIEGDAAWEDMAYGFIEIGFKFGYVFGKEKAGSYSSKRNYSSNLISH